MRHFPAAVVVLLAACSPEAAIERVVPPAHDRFARDYIQLVADQELDRAVQSLAPGVDQQPGIRDSLAAASQHLPPGAYDSLRLVGAERLHVGSVDQTLLTYEVYAASGLGLVHVHVAEELGLRYTAGFRTERIPAPLAELNALTWRGKTAAHLIMVTLAVASLVTGIAVAVVAVRTPMPRRWLWALVAILGGSRWAFNWSTGAVASQLLAITVPPATLMRVGLAGPWIMTVAFPVGALLTYERVRRFRTRQAATPTAASRGEAIEGELSPPAT